MDENRRRKKCGYNSDTLMLGLWRHLVQDFRSAHGDSSYAMSAEKALLSGIKVFREYKFPDRFQAPPYIFKTEYQLENLFKRYQFESDAFTEVELEERTNGAFLDLQKVLGTPRKGLREFSFRVAQEVRKLVREALGPYDAEEHMQFCRFGKKACKGVSLRNSYLDYKMEHVTGSREHIRWFVKNYLPTDKLLSDAIFCGPLGPEVEVCDHLDMNNVPKSWKIKRGICPNTTIGSFYTYGLGAIFQDRLLKHFGLNIKHCQNRHRTLARRYSVTRSHVTADLSNASNSYTFELLCRFLPRDWLSAVKLGRLKYVKLTNSKSMVYTPSYMMMGIGYTFTLQTLLFLCIIKGVQNLLGDTDGTVSVYGDDLIYPRRIHSYVSAVLVDFGFQLNTDKTFVVSHFRESCGGDYYHGVDVRPFQPEGRHQILKPRSYVLLLYKTINGLKERWSECEIPITLRWLYAEILRVDYAIFQVPPHFPDYSGVRVEAPRAEFWIPWVKPQWSTKTQSYNILCYRQEPYERFVIREFAYYWEAMRSSSLKEEVSPYDSLTDKPSILGFVEAKNQPRNYRSYVSRKRIRKLVAYIARKGAQRVTKATIPADSSFEEPRAIDFAVEAKLRGFNEKGLWRTKVVPITLKHEPCGVKDPLA